MAVVSLFNDPMKVETLAAISIATDRKAKAPTTTVMTRT